VVMSRNSAGQRVLLNVVLHSCWSPRVQIIFFIATFILSLTAYLLFAVYALCTLARCETESGPWVSRCPW